MKTYVALVRRSSRGFAITFPDVPDCHSEGVSIDEARLNASHALALKLQSLVGAGDVVPAPSSVAEIVRNPAWRQEEIDAIIVAVRPVVRKGDTDK